MNHLHPLRNAIRASVILISILCCCLNVYAQELKTKNVILITLDGFRWKEVFEGADESILFDDKFSNDTLAQQKFWNNEASARREKLLPFFWNTIGVQGQLYGNRDYGNKVNCKNHHLLSYPGYSEMLVGYPERKVSSNDLKVNPNPTVLEFISDHHDYRNQVAAFATWDAFPYILREQKSNIHVNAGTDVAKGDITAREEKLNALQFHDKNPHGSRYDKFTFQYAMEYLKRERPKVMFIGFDETDEHGHGGRYDEYLTSAHAADSMINHLWQWVQSQEDYKDQTTILITTDHGRGNGKCTWKNHRLLAAGSRHIWFAVLGPDTPAFGEMKVKAKYYQNQVAKTIASFLGLQYQPEEEAGDVVQTMLAVPLQTIEDASARNLSLSTGNDEK